MVSTTSSFEVAAASPCSLELISHGTIFFSHNKTVLAGLSAAETIQRTRCTLFAFQIVPEQSVKPMYEQMMLKSLLYHDKDALKPRYFLIKVTSNYMFRATQEDGSDHTHA
jgi:hypothetical protein